MNFLFKTFLMGAILLHSLSAFAYVGPGLGAGVVVTVLGILAGIVMLVVGVVWYPIKRLLKRRKTRT